MNKKLARVFSVIFITATIFSLVSCTELEPKVPQEISEKSNWSWNASSVSVLKFFGLSNITQSQFMQVACGNTDDVSKSINEVSDYLKMWGLTSRYETAPTDGDVAFNLTKNRIGNNQPLIAVFSFEKSGYVIGSKMVVVLGHTDARDDSSSDSIEYMDPETGDYDVKSKDLFISETDANDSTITRIWRSSLTDFTKNNKWN